MTNMQEKYAAKIAKLLAKAESTTPEEAESLVSKAQELMTQYTIEQAMVDAARGFVRDEVEQRTIYFTGNYRQELMDIARKICATNNCMGVQFSTLHDDGGRKAVKVRPNKDGTYRSEVTSMKKAFGFEITGYSSDLERVFILETSLRLQSFSAMTHWWAEHEENNELLSYRKKVRARQEFFEGFGIAVGHRLAEAAKAGQKEATKTEAARTNVDVDEANISVELVLRDRKDSVQDWYDKHYGNSLRNVSRRYRPSVSETARQSGFSAGARADLGQGHIKETKGLNS